MKNELPYCKTSEAIIGYEQSDLAKTENNDCVVRAFASAYEISYEMAHKFISERFGRKNRQGTYGFNSKMNKIGEIKELIHNHYIKILGEKKMIGSFVTGGYSLSYDVKVKGEIKRRQMTVGTFAKKYPKGNFIMSVKRHAFTIKDGVVVGNTEDCRRLKAIVEQVWEVVKF